MQSQILFFSLIAYVRFAEIIDLLIRQSPTQPFSATTLWSTWRSCLCSQALAEALRDNRTIVELDCQQVDDEQLKARPRRATMVFKSKFEFSY